MPEALFIWLGLPFIGNILISLINTRMENKDKM
jgi:hypothetical protein